MLGQKKKLGLDKLKTCPFLDTYGNVTFAHAALFWKTHCCGGVRCDFNAKQLEPCNMIKHFMLKMDLGNGNSLNQSQRV